MNTKTPGRRLLGSLCCILGLFAFFLLIFYPHDLLGDLVAGILLLALLVLVLWRRGPARTEAWDRPALRVLLLLPAAGLICASFFYRWTAVDKYRNLANHYLAKIGVPLRVVLALGIVAGVVFSVLFFLRLRRSLLTVPVPEPSRDKVPGRGPAVAVCAVTAFAAITICSRCSFLYPFNDWVDANCFFTVGKGIMNGMVPYRDLFEQKGPLLYLLHGLAWLVDHDGFLGVYFIELAASFCFLYYSWRTMALSCGRRALYLVPVLAMVVYTAQSFVYGDSAEELCMPLAAWAIWIGARCLRDGKPISRLEGYLIGFTSGCIFWTKFTLVGFYVGWFLVPAWQLLKNRQGGELLRLILRIALGVAASTLPWVIYFGLNGSIGVWLEVYVYDNMFIYPSDLHFSFLEKLQRGMLNIDHYFPVALFLGLLGLVRSCLTGKLRQACYVFAIFGATFLGIYYGGIVFAYYPFYMSLFIPFGLAVIGELLPEGGKVRTAILVPVTALCAALCLLLSPNTYQIGEKKENMPQFKFAEIIRQEENPTLLNFGFLDGGFYTAAELLPNCRAFCALNTPLLSIRKVHRDCVKEGSCMFVVTRSFELDDPKYECVAEASYFFVYDFVYRLYKRIDNPANP